MFDVRGCLPCSASQLEDKLRSQGVPCGSGFERDSVELCGCTLASCSLRHPRMEWWVHLGLVHEPLAKCHKLQCTNEFSWSFSSSGRWTSHPDVDVKAEDVHWALFSHAPRPCRSWVSATNVGERQPQPINCSITRSKVMVVMSQALGFGVPWEQIEVGQPRPQAARSSCFVSTWPWLAKILMAKGIPREVPAETAVVIRRKVSKHWRRRQVATQ